MKNSVLMPVIVLFCFSFFCQAWLCKKDIKKVADVSEQTPETKIEFASRVVKRASEMCQVIRDTFTRDFILYGLEHLTIREARLDTFRLESKITLLILEDQAMETFNNDSSGSPSENVFTFFSDELIKSGKAAFGMNAKACTNFLDLDGLASCLIHEFVHALQSFSNIDAKNHLKPLPFSNSFLREKQAWDYQFFVYHENHPEMTEVICDCSDFHLSFGKVNQQSINFKDPIVKNLIVYAKCKDKFLHALYPELGG
ncbi:MAG: hypothetical protein V4439_03705 [Patescibacteria group bacterium]